MPMRIYVLVLAVVALLTTLGVFAADRRGLTGVSRKTSPADSDETPAVIELDFAAPEPWEILPRYVDVNVGDSVRVTKADGSSMEFRLEAVEIENGSHHHPRTRVDLWSDGHIHSARCGVVERSRGGVGPVQIDGVKVAVEITKPLYSKMKRGYSNYNSYRHFRLRGEVRLAVWDSAVGIMRGVRGQFPLDQNEWSRDRLGNWLHSTAYGFHSATDIFATTHGVPEPVLSPVDGTVHRVYYKGQSPDDRTNAKTILIYGDTIVGPDGQKVLYRLMHLSKILVSKGQRVKRGDVIGFSGHSGFNPSIGDHVHFEMRIDPSFFGEKPLKNFIGTVPLNPYNYLLEWWDDASRRAEEGE
jgi:murein DD-endopeptidase MepM/ murein hydrolase activator NlpD